MTLLFVLTLQRQRLAAIETVLNKFGISQLFVCLKRWELNLVAIGIIVESLVMKREWMVHICVIDQTFGEILTFTGGRIKVFLLFKDLFIRIIWYSP
jgi:hypothetical protein